MPRKNYEDNLKKVRSGLRVVGKSCTPSEDLAVPCPGKRLLVFGPAMPYRPPDFRPKQYAAMPIGFLPKGVARVVTGNSVIPVRTQKKSGLWPAVGKKNDEKNAPRMDWSSKEQPDGSWKYVMGKDGKPIKRTPEQERQRLIETAIHQDKDLQKDLRKWKEDIECKKNTPSCGTPTAFEDPDNPESASGLDVKTYVQLQSTVIPGGNGVTPGVCIKFRFKCVQPTVTGESSTGGAGRGGGTGGKKKKRRGSSNDEDDDRLPYDGTFDPWNDEFFDPHQLYGSDAQASHVAASLVDHALRTFFPQQPAPFSRNPESGHACCENCRCEDRAPRDISSSVGNIATALYLGGVARGWVRRSAFWEAAAVFDQVINRHGIRSAPER